MCASLKVCVDKDCQMLYVQIVEDISCVFIAFIGMLCYNRFVCFSLFCFSILDIYIEVRDFRLACSVVFTWDCRLFNFLVYLIMPAGF